MNELIEFSREIGTQAWELKLYAVWFNGILAALGGMIFAVLGFVFWRFGTDDNDLTLEQPSSP